MPADLKQMNQLNVLKTDNNDMNEKNLNGFLFNIEL